MTGANGEYFAYGKSMPHWKWYCKCEAKIAVAIQTLQAHVAAWRCQIGPKACFRQYASDIVDKNMGDYWWAGPRFVRSERS